MTDKTGGRRFPQTVQANPGEYAYAHSGMTLRDYFAGESLQGYRSGDQMAPPRVVARDSYADADAMLEERDK